MTQHDKLLKAYQQGWGVRLRKYGDELWLVVTDKDMVLDKIYLCDMEGI